MYANTLLYATLPLLVLATTVPSSISQTIVPFSTLPLCAQKCGPLFDAQGACGQTALTSTSQSCFCSYTTLVPFRTSSAGVCDASASGCSAADLTTIQSWYKTYCANVAATTSSSAKGAATTSAGAVAAATTSAAAASTAAASSGGTWLSSHYKYVIMIVVVCVGLAAIWIAGCLLRRRHLRKRDRAFAQAGPEASWGPSQSHSDFNLNHAAANPAMQSREEFAMSRSSSFFGSGAPEDTLQYYQSKGKGKSPLSEEVMSEKQPNRISKLLPGRH